MTDLFHKKHPFSRLGPGDCTVIPPPCLSVERAAEIYGPAFRNAVEYVALCRIEGDVLEFGTLTGYTARWLAELVFEYGHGAGLYLYDSFEGFPEMRGNDAECYEVRQGAWVAGGPRVGADNGNPEVIREVLSAVLGAERVTVTRGWYDTVLPAALPKRPAAIVHVDCDLYGSTLTVLNALISGKALQQGTVIFCDDWNNNRGSNLYGERKAMAEVFSPPAMSPRCGFTVEPWFAYGWGGQAFLVHAG